MTAQHAYRVEISGGHTGSSECYLSFLSGTLDGALAYARKNVGCPQMGACIAIDSLAVSLDLWVDGNLQGRTPLLPAATVTGSGHTLTYEGPNIPVFNGVRLGDWELREQHMCDLEEFFCDGPRVEFDVVRFDLPLVAGTPLPDGETWTVTSLAGKAHAQPCGEEVGDLCMGL